MTRPFDQSDLSAIHAIRMLAVDATRRANSGHPGMPMGAAPVAHILWSRILRHAPGEPRWPGRDRFILSAGHASMLLYSLLHLHGYPLALDDLKAFRQWGSRTPGHPERDPDLGVEMTTGPLGQGIATAVGMAIAQAHLSTRFDRPGFPLFDHRIWVMASDGDLMEGLSAEAGSLAGHLRLSSLKVVYDDNHVSIEGDTQLAFTEDVLKRYEAYGWKTLRVADGNDLHGVEQALLEADAETQRPVIVAVRTQIGYGSPFQGTSRVHGAPLPPEAVVQTKQFFDWPQEPDFHVPPEALKRCRESVERGRVLAEDWARKREEYRKAYPSESEKLEEALARRVPVEIDHRMPVYPPDAKGLATRVASGRAINALAKELPFLVGGSADLGESNNTVIEHGGDFSAENRAGRVLHFGVREHAMAAALNGMALYGGVIPFGGTFLIFADYMKPALRLAHLMRLPSVFVFTHDSIGVGEDGPTHQPVESLALLRSIPGARVIRPCDANETSQAWLAAVRRSDGPTCLVLTRQNLPVLDRSKLAPASLLHQGAYVLSDNASGAPKVILIGTGSEVSLCLKAQERLHAEGVPTRVVSAPCLELFAAQPAEYRDQVLPPEVTARVVVEAASSFGWCRWAGPKGRFVTLDRFGASAPAATLFEQFGFTVDHVVHAAKESLA
jgi:transketolase